MKQSKIIILLINFFLIIQSNYSQNKEILGYLPYYQFDHVDDIDFNKLSQVCIAFANPTADTSIILENNNYDDYNDIVSMLHEKNIEVFISLAGGAVYEPEYQRWLDFTEEENLAIFIGHIMSYCRQHELDGVDFDLEWNLIEDVGAKYENFTLMMADSLWNSGMKILGTFPGTYRYNALSDLCLETFDQINLMSYNLTGPWAPNNPGPHAPYSFAVQSIDYWKAQNVDGNKILLGVPFYGFDFDSTPVSSFTYRSMVNQNTDYAFLDQVGQKYYNGIATIKDKTILAMDETNGIMIWELGQDYFGEYSLLNIIYETMYTGIQVEEDKELSYIDAFPNPVKDVLNIQNNTASKANYWLISPTAQIIQKGQIPNKSQIHIFLNHLNSGMYILQTVFPSSGKKQILKIIKL